MTSADTRSIGDHMLAHLASLDHRNAATLDAVADLLTRVVERDGLVYPAGSGHSTAMVLETFFRAGGLANVYPVTHPALSPLAGGAASTLAERTTGLADVVLAPLPAGPDDAAVIFSNSGINAVPVELARGFRSRGTAVVAVLSRAALAGAPARAGVRLADIADHVLDTDVPAGDAVYPSGPAATAALSSLAAVYCWNLVLARLADRAAVAGLELPLWASANTVAGDERNAALAERFRARIPTL